MSCNAVPLLVQLQFHIHYEFWNRGLSPTRVKPTLHITEPGQRALRHPRQWNSPRFSTNRVCLFKDAAWAYQLIPCAKLTSMKGLRSQIGSWWSPQENLRSCLPPIWSWVTKTNTETEFTLAADLEAKSSGRPYADENFMMCLRQLGYTRQLYFPNLAGIRNCGPNLGTNIAGTLVFANGFRGASTWQTLRYIRHYAPTRSFSFI